MAKKLNLVDMYGIGVMLEYLVAEDNLTCEERDRVILRIARENNIAEYMLSNLAGYGRSKQEVLKRAERRKSSELQGKKQDESLYLSDRDCPSSQRGCSRICDTELAEKWKYFSILKSLGTGEQSEL